MKKILIIALMLVTLLIIAIGYRTVTKPVTDNTTPPTEITLPTENNTPIETQASQTAPEDTTAPPVETEPEPDTPTPDLIVPPEPPVKEAKATLTFGKIEIPTMAIAYVTDNIKNKFTIFFPTFAKLSPNDGYGGAFAIKNNKQKAQDFRVNVQFDKAYTKSNNVIFVNETEMLDWIELPGSFSLDPGEMGIAPIKAIIPEDVEKGTYEFMLQAEFFEDQYEWVPYYGEFTLALKVE